MRAILSAIALSIALSGAAFADASVAGDWHANLGHHIVINMTIAPDTAWSSVTLQNGKAIRRMKGTYTQIPSSGEAGTIVFTPTQAMVKEGTVEPENDKYELSPDGKVLKLTADDDTMVFQKRVKH